MGARRLSNYLARYESLIVPYGTIHHILRKNKDRIKYKKLFRKHEKREFVDWYSAAPFEIVQIDLKEIRDQKALSKAQIIHLDRFDIPNYQWGAIDISSRFKLIAYSREKTWTNGLCFYLWVISWLRSHGLKVDTMSWLRTDYGIILFSPISIQNNILLVCSANYGKANIFRKKIFLGNIFYHLLINFVNFVDFLLWS